MTRTPPMTHAGSLEGLAISATTHCLTGCAIGEVTGMVIALAVGSPTFSASR